MEPRQRMNNLNFTSMDMLARTLLSYTPCPVGGDVRQLATASPALRWLQCAVTGASQQR